MDSRGCPYEVDSLIWHHTLAVTLCIHKLLSLLNITLKSIMIWMVPTDAFSRVVSQGTSFKNDLFVSTDYFSSRIVSQHNSFRLLLLCSRCSPELMESIWAAPFTLDVLAQMSIWFAFVKQVTSIYKEKDKGAKSCTISLLHSHRSGIKVPPLTLKLSKQVMVQNAFPYIISFTLFIS